MFLKVLRPVSISPTTNQLPRTPAVSSFYLPKIAEQGFGIPVRQIDGDYRTALHQRLNALIRHDAIKASIKHMTIFNNLQRMRGLRVRPSHGVKSIVPPHGGVVSSHFMVDDITSQMLNTLLFVKDDNDAETIGLSQLASYIAYVNLDSLPYLTMLFGLELYGVVNGTLYEYDKMGPVAGYPSHYDIRTIVIDSWAFEGVTSILGMTEVEILLALQKGVDIDEDATALHDFFRQAFRAKSRKEITSLNIRRNVTYEPYVAGREHPVGMMTRVKAI